MDVALILVVFPVQSFPVQKSSVAAMIQNMLWRWWTCTHPEKVGLCKIWSSGYEISNFSVKINVASASHFFHLFSFTYLTAIQMEALRVALGEELFNMCYEEDGHILRVVGGALQDFLNSFNVLLKQCSTVHNQDREDCVNEPSVLCLDRDLGLLTVYFFNPRPTTELFFPGVIKAAARLLYHTTVDVLMDPPTTKDNILQSSPQPSLLYTVVVKDATNLSPSPLRATSAGTLPTSLFSTIFPFHLILDQDLVLVQIGHALRKRLTRKDGPRRSATFQEHFSIVSPQIKCTFQGILTMLNTQFTIRIKHGASTTHTTGKVCEHIWGIETLFWSK